MSPLITLLLASVGPLLVGFDIITNDDEDTDDDTDPPVVDPGDEIETVDVVSFIEDARGIVGDEGPINTSRGTDAVQNFIGVEDESNSYDASGGEDTLTGGMLADTLIGGEDSDRIGGGDGDDVIFGGFQRETRPDDEDADTLSGGEGDDTLFMGNGDTAIGGAGTDIFVTVQDMTQNTTITDFNPDEDVIAVEAVDPDALSVVEQAVSDDGLTITLSSGATITLEGLEETINLALIHFVEVSPLLPSARAQA